VDRRVLETPISEDSKLRGIGETLN
jgi:hypothetical protein